MRALLDVNVLPLVTGVGYDWAIEKTAQCIGELVALVQPDGGNGRHYLLDVAESPPATAEPPPVTITCKSGDDLDHLDDGSVDAVVMDPPYYDNVMYAELSDFFCVWLKRTAGHVFPELFRRKLTDKENEAVANPARFAGQPGARALAGRDYQQRMAAIFAECRRVLKADGATSRRSTTCTVWPTTTASTSRTSCASGGRRADSRAAHAFSGWRPPPMPLTRPSRP